MNFKELNTEEIEALPREKRYAYYDELRLRQWHSKSWNEKQQEIFAGYDLYIGRRGIEGITLEEIIEVAIKNNPNEHSGFISPIIKLYNEKFLINEDYTFFWKTKSPFSQWFKSDFIATTCLIIGLGSGQEYKIKKNDLIGEYFQSETHTYSSMEQFMMFHKAIIFLDLESAKEVMNTNNVREIKELGRQVKNFDEEIWQFYRSKVVYEGNKAKFSQNEELKRALIATKGTTLVEAAYNDSIWGIGLSEDDPKSRNRKTWKGKNLLGEILTILREEIINKTTYNNS